jgi:hypothetical protein
VAGLTVIDEVRSIWVDVHPRRVRERARVGDDELDFVVDAGAVVVVLATNEVF